MEKGKFMRYIIKLTGVFTTILLSLALPSFLSSKVLAQDAPPFSDYDPYPCFSDCWGNFSECMSENHGVLLCWNNYLRCSGSCIRPPVIIIISGGTLQDVATIVGTGNLEGPAVDYVGYLDDGGNPDPIVVNVAGSDGVNNVALASTTAVHVWSIPASTLITYPAANLANANWTDLGPATYNEERGTFQLSYTPPTSDNYILAVSASGPQFSTPALSLALAFPSTTAVPLFSSTDSVVFCILLLGMGVACIVWPVRGRKVFGAGLTSGGISRQ